MREKRQALHLIRPVRAAQGDSASMVHEFLPRRSVVAFVFVSHALNHSRGGIGFK